MMVAEEPAVLLHDEGGCSNTETAAVLFSNSGAEDHDKHTFGDVDQEGGHDDDHRSYGGGGGNRWPRQETLALLKIRSQMDPAFRDSSLKAPLWEDVSRKLGELGYQRSAKKCKEKFENVYKYHRRTKEGRSGKPEGKTYRFFDELEAFDHQQNSHNLSIIPPKPPVVLWTNNSNHHPNQSVPPPVVTVPQNGVTPATDPIIHSSTNNSLLPQQIHSSQDNTNGFRLLNPTTNLFSSSTSSTTASDEEFQQRNKRKRKWKYFFRRLTKQVLEKQERLQENFLEAIAKCDQERMVKEEAWRMQEMARIDRDHEVLVQERSSAAAKDAALIQFLQKVSLQHNSNDTRSLEINDATAMLVIPPPTNVPRPPLPALPVSWAIDQRGLTASSDGAVAPRNLEAKKVYGNGENNSAVMGSSRWPKTEVQALIDLRTSLDVKYQDAGPKGSLWEEISAGMRRLGYNRSSKRCKEKWENINKYFKKVKESSKTRPEDSKTCPYFHQLEALYRNKNNNKIEYHKDRSVEKLQIVQQPLRENVDPNQEEDEHDDHGDQDGESTEEDQEHDQIGGTVTSYKQSSMEMVES
ncbi:PREDICTED: trihelix transcription factor GT-2-like [Fragaria vesca subsp. vesca]|uniref:trihelix transcription factor GT-2-like n=1 Tax=Fragaria vesca subsp. vesca TaxID=101020 RepID=UPI0002C319BD|nr:PREDICTED: trihelix transcription factor GT-2-like [Fragaria vesca subsp. vesca]